MMHTMPADYTITFDGGSRGNPGQGYGSYELRTATKHEIVRLTFSARETNNEAEYKTLIGGLKDLIGRIEGRGEQPTTYTLAVRGDSQLVINQVCGTWKVKTPHMRPLHAEAVALLARFKQADVRWHRRDHSVDVLGH